MQVGDYTIVRELGRGGMGIVYEARHPTLDRPVAIKVILRAVADATSLKRFLQEAELLARITHPNVLRVHGLGAATQGPYLVVEYLEGEDLNDLAKRGPLPPQRAAEIALALAAALRALHAAGILHRDLKPHNVILKADGTPVLLDFGLARDVSADRLTQTGAVLGTPSYMPPEQAGGDAATEPDVRSDVYGLGAILFAMLAGRPPFAGGAVQVMKQVLLDEPRWPSRDLPQTPRELEAICQQAMAKTPSDRYPDIESMAQDLGRYLRGEPVQAKLRRRRVAKLAALGTLAAFGLLSAGALAWALTRPPEAGPKPPTPERQPEARVDLADAAPPPDPTIDGWTILAPGPPSGHEWRHLDVQFVSDDEVLCVWEHRAETLVVRLDKSIARSYRYPREWSDVADSRPGPARSNYTDKVGVRRVDVDRDRSSVLLATRGWGRGLVKFDPQASGPAVHYPLPKELTGVSGMAHTPDGRFLLGGYRGELVLLSLNSREAHVGEPYSRTNPAKTVVISRDGALAFVAGGEVEIQPGSPSQSEASDYAIRTFRLPELTFLSEVPAHLDVLSAALSADGKLIAFGTRNHSIQVHPVLEGGLGPPVFMQGGGDARTRLEGGDLFATAPAAHRAGVCALAFYEDDRRLISGSGYGGDKNTMTKGDVRTWNVATGEQLSVSLAAEKLDVASIDVSPNGHRVVIGIWDGEALIRDLPFR